MNTLSKILEAKIVAIVRGANAADVLKIVEALYKGGVRAVEITLNSPKALSVIEHVSDKMGNEMLVGAGTVLDPESAKAAIAAGAKFIISPVVDIETIRLTKRYGVVSIPGAFTPTEILAAFTAGGDIIKVFPASLGAAYFKDIHGPLSQIPLMPTGGVMLENIKEFVDAGAVAFGIGSALVNAKHEVNDLYFDQLTEKAAAFISAVNSL